MDKIRCSAAHKDYEEIKKQEQQNKIVRMRNKKPTILSGSDNRKKVITLLEVEITF